jgi:hypothetical protein
VVGGSNPSGRAYRLAVVGVEHEAARIDVAVAAGLRDELRRDVCGRAFFNS